MIRFFQKREFIKNILAVFVILIMLSSSLFPLFIPKKAEASVPIHCTMGLDFNCVKEAILDLLARVLVSSLIRSLTNSIIGWIQGNGGTNVGYVGNFEDEFRRQIDGRAGEFLNNLAGVNLCGNIGFHLQINLRTHPGFRDYFQCTLTDIVDNVDNFFQDFGNGGWNALMNTVFVPKNNPYGAFLIGLDKKIDAEQGLLESLHRRLLSGIGYEGVRVQEKHCTDTPLVGPLPEGTEETEENGQYCYTETVTKTPGHLVADMLNRTVGSGYDFAFVVDEIDEAIETIILTLINELINSTLEGIFNPSLSDLPDVDVDDPTTLHITTTSLPDGEVGVQYNFQLVATNGVPPYSWSLSSGSLPAGLTLNGTGVISGTPQKEGILGFNIKVADSFGATDLQSLSLTIDAGHFSAHTPGVGGCITVDTLSPGAEAPELDPSTTVSLPEGTKEKGYCVHLALSPGVGTTGGTWTTKVTEGALPPGLTLYQAEGGATPPANQHPEISGFPTTGGKYDFTVTDILVITEDESPSTTGWKQDYSITVSSLSSTDASTDSSIATSPLSPPPPPPPLPPKSQSQSQQKETVSMKPSITSLIPFLGPIGTKITLTGTNFTDENRIYFGGYHAATIRKQDGTMSFNVPSVSCFAIVTPKQNCNIPSPNPGNYNVSVINSNGTSNNVVFTVTAP